MTRSLIRTLLRRRVQEVTADQWQDADLNELINLAYQRMEMDILAVNPDAFIATYRADIVSGQALYEKPAGFNYEVAFKVLDQSSSEYKRIEMIDYNVALDRTSEQGYKYSHFGSYFYLSPEPATPLTAGIELDFVPSLSMTGDSDVPKIPQPLHMGVVHHSVLLALGETGEETKREMEALSTLINKIPGYYLKSAAASAFNPAIQKYP